MSWVSIDYDKCNGCRACLDVCRRCFFLEDETVVVHADEDCCSLCGHCVSICSPGAIEHHNMEMDNFIDTGKDEFITTEDFFEFLRQRRSHRHFKKQDIPKQDMPEWMRSLDYKTQPLDWDLYLAKMNDWMRRWDLEVKGRGKARHGGES